MTIEPNQSNRVYNWSLLFSFVANVFQLVSVSLLFRYSDFIASLGGNEWHLGWVVGVASTGAILIRLFLGSAVDRVGPEPIWYVCLLGQILGLIWHMFVDTPDGWDLYLARTVYAASLAGTFGAWLSFVSLQAPEHRVAEVIGVVGASGFVGMATGPVVGDYIFQSQASFDTNVQTMLLVSIGALLAAYVFAIAACRTGHIPREIGSGPYQNPIQVILKAKPGFSLVLGALMGLTIGFPGTYLRPMAQSLNVEQIKLFFVVYNLTAFCSRLLFRQAPQKLGLKNTICLGYMFMTLSMLLYLVVDNQAGLIWPALAGGLAHSFLFPSVIALCTEKFSVEDRGVATNLILAMYDSGVLIGMPAVGAILTFAKQWSLPSYSAAVVAISFSIVFVLASYFAASDNRSDSASFSTTK